MSQARAARIKLYGLVAARWMLIGVVLVIEALEALRADRGWDSLAWRPEGTHVAVYVGVTLAWAAANVGTMIRLRSAREIAPAWAGVHLLVDVAAITALLALSGGKTNPFTIVYFVPITLATQVSPRWTWAVGVSSVIGFAALFALDPAIGAAAAAHGGDAMPGMSDMHDMHGGAAHFSGHLRGMWFAFGVTGALVTYFVNNIAKALAKQRDELTTLRERALEDRHLAQVGSLSAGAAHELGTPLATLNILASDLERMSPEELAETSQTMVSEIRRCKTIVQRMAGPELRAASITSLDVEPWPLSRLQSGLGDDIADVTYSVDDDDARVSSLPCNVISQMLRELITNARHASADREADTRIDIRATTDGEDAVLTVNDTGPGMPEDVATAAFDPFFSTKPEGKATGMGLYLVRAQLRQLGGNIELESALGRGTQITLRFPLRHSPEPDSDHGN